MNFSIELFLAIIILSCEANRYDRTLFNNLYLSRQGSYRDPGYDIIERSGNRNEVNYENVIHQNILVPYVEKPQDLRTERNTFSLPASNLIQTNHGEPIVEPFHIGPKVNFAAVDKKVLSRLRQADREFIEANLTPAEREALLAKVENEGDHYSLTEDRFGGFSLSAIAAELGTGAGQFIGSKLAGPLGAQLGAAIGTYLAIAAAEAVGSTPVKAEASVVSNNGTDTNVETVAISNRRKINRYI